MQRWMYFAKYLKENSIEPIILTIDQKSAKYSRLDNSFEDFISEIEVHKTKAVDFIKYYSILKSGKKNGVVPQGEVKKSGIINYFARLIRGNYFIPDARIGWNKFALKKAYSILDQNDIDLVISTGPPHSSHLIAERIKTTRKIKWLVDFRDPWIDVFYYNDFLRTKKAESKDRDLERFILEKADFVSTVGPNLESLLKSKVKESVHSKFFHVYNGFDANKMKSISSLKKHTEFRMVYVGVLTNHQPYDKFLEALYIAVNQFDGKRDVIIEFCGKIDSDILLKFQSIKGLKVENNGVVSHKQALEKMSRANLLLIFLPRQLNANLMISGKLMEYYATGNPILFIGDKTSDGAQIIKNANNSFLFDENDDANKISNSIVENFEKDLHEARSIEEFSRESLSKKMAKHINNIIDYNHSRV